MLLTLLLRMEWFRSLRTARFAHEPLVLTPQGLPIYYAGHLGSVVSIAGCFPAQRGEGQPEHRTILGRFRRARRVFEATGQYPKWTPKITAVRHLASQPHYRTRHLRVQVRLATTTASGRHASVARGAHVLVLVAWYGPPGSGNAVDDYWMDGCHLDGDPQNNRLDNLVWGDREMNAAQREAHKREHEGQMRWDASGQEVRDDSGFVYVPDAEFGF